MRPEGEDWITANEAAEILEVQAETVRHLAREGKLETRRTGVSGPVSFLYFSRRQILQRAESRAQKRHINIRQQRKERQERILIRLEEFSAQEWITVREAAAILNVSRSQIYRNVAEKRLIALQDLPGHKGSALRLSREQVEAYRDSPARQKRVEKFYKSKPIYVPSAQERAEDADPEPISPWVSTEQIVYWLGVSAATVHWFRKSGQVYYYKVGLRPRGYCYLHSKSDVKKIINSPEYQKRSAARYQAYINRLNKQINICADIADRHKTHWLDHPLPPQGMW